MRNNEMGFCQNCGGRMEKRNVDARIRAVCQACGTIYYDHWRVSAGARVEKEDKLLLIQRCNDPWKGCWHMPAGYVESDEDPMRAAEREVREETGLTVKAGRLVNIYPDYEDPRGNVLVIIYEGSIIQGQAIHTAEAMDIGFFDANQIKDLPLAGLSAERSIRDWVDGKVD